MSSKTNTTNGAEADPPDTAESMNSIFTFTLDASRSAEIIKAVIDVGGAPAHVASVAFALRIIAALEADYAGNASKLLGMMVPLDVDFPRQPECRLAAGLLGLERVGDTMALGLLLRPLFRKQSRPYCFFPGFRNKFDRLFRFERNYTQDPDAEEKRLLQEYRQFVSYHRNIELVGGEYAENKNRPTKAGENMIRYVDWLYRQAVGGESIHHIAQTLDCSSEHKSCNCRYSVQRGLNKTRALLWSRVFTEEFSGVLVRAAALMAGVKPLPWPILTKSVSFLVEVQNSRGFHAWATENNPSL
jgi:hypothetical protein